MLRAYLTIDYIRVEGLAFMFTITVFGVVQVRGLRLQL